MKVRHKRHLGPHYEVVEESPSYYVVSDGWKTPTIERLLPKSDYEPIPTETWRDVTGECEVQEGARGGVRIVHGMFYVEGNGGYRLRKVRIKEGQVDDNTWINATAFIVEKREP
jgi:hypothetical protein